MNSNNLDRLLAAASDFDASDLHLVAGIPPAFRVNGEIIIADEDALSESEAELIASAPLTVVTRGEQGSTLYTSQTNGQGLHIPVAPIADVVDPTGAGDAYLGGLVFGLARRFPLEVTGRVAALAATYAIEHRGGQEHTYTPASFAERYTTAFGAAAEIDALAESVTR